MESNDSIITYGKFKRARKIRVSVAIFTDAYFPTINNLCFDKLLLKIFNSFATEANILIYFAFIYRSA